jgi:hypothetical protein
LAPCRPCPRATRRINLRTRWARWPASRSMPGWRRGRMNARSWNGCVATLPGRRYRKSACRSLRMVTCGTNSRRRTAKACPLTDQTELHLQIEFTSPKNVALGI